MNFKSGKQLSRMETGASSLRKGNSGWSVIILPKLQLNSAGENDRPVKVNTVWGSVNTCVSLETMMSRLPHGNGTRKDRWQKKSKTSVCVKKDYLQVRYRL